MDEAIHKLYHSIDQKVYWGHFSYLVVSEEAMKEGKLSPVIDTFTRFKDTRYHIWVYTTKDPVVDILLVRPILNKAITLSKLGDPENSFEQESFVEPVDIRMVLIGLDQPSHEAMIPLISIEENWQKAKEPIKATVLSGVGSLRQIPSRASLLLTNPEEYNGCRMIRKEGKSPSRWMMLITLQW